MRRDRPMNWFANHRQEWIAQMLRAYGFINRQHLMRHFGISNPQAAIDFRVFNDQNPGVMIYDARRKTYVASEPPQSFT